MATTETLTSLAMLKVNLDQKHDYLDYLAPFIQQILVDFKPDPITDDIIHDKILEVFGLEIPNRAIQIVLKRLTRTLPIHPHLGVLRITGEIENPGISYKKVNAQLQITNIIIDLRRFSVIRNHPLKDDEEAMKALGSFLSEFNIPFLKNYLRGTAIPTIEDRQRTHIILVSDYLVNLKKRKPELEPNLNVLIQGHMLANALLCPDLKNSPRSYKGVDFYLDTPLIVRRLGLEGQPKKRAVKEMIKLVRNLGGKIAIFAHTRDELSRVIAGAANHVESLDGRGAIVYEARRQQKTRSDLLFLETKLDDELESAGIEVVPTPRYNLNYQIDEQVFESMLDDEIAYYNPRAREYDVNSVRSIFALRSGSQPTAIERSRAAFVSCNAAFARAAYIYGKNYEETREVSSVITDFSLANMAWLKAPMGAPRIPMNEVLAYSYAALQPTKSFLDKFVTEVEKLEKQGLITPRDHQLLRSNTIVNDELVRLTLGDEAALTESTITETLERVSSEIKQEECEKTELEKKAHKKTREELQQTQIEQENLKERIYWRCHRQARIFANTVAYVLAIILLLGIWAGYEIQSSNKTVGVLLMVLSGISLLFSLLNQVFGSTVRRVSQNIEQKCLIGCLNRESRATGTQFSIKAEED